VPELVFAVLVYFKMSMGVVNFAARAAPARTLRRILESVVARSLSATGARELHYSGG
jgi:hypothetical protein